MPNPDSNPYFMWASWRDDKGILNALQDYYPKTLKANPKLQAAIVQIESAEAYIDKIMKDLAELEEESG